MKKVAFIVGALAVLFWACTVAGAPEISSEILECG